jgi:hypothetical protein
MQEILRLTFAIQVCPRREAPRGHRHLQPHPEAPDQPVRREPQCPPIQGDCPRPISCDVLARCWCAA